MTTWAGVAKGDRVELGGKPFTVEKIKVKGKAAKVTVTGRGGTFTSELKAKTEVKRLEPAAKPPKKGKAASLDGPRGEQQRWATEAEKREADEWLENRTTEMPAGDPWVTKRPAKAEGGPWEEPKGEAEKLVAEVLGAKLIAEGDETVGVYVPPVDVSTIAAHLLIFHGVGGDGYASTADALALHAQHHTDAKKGAAMKTNHWHVKERP